ncbi:hypothetical protein [Taibaiella chishuiensis]|uniref:OmpA family protein n=1 Tax=Taibaiella chishuiensis TaxID=1434707 RepID=A0A2P8D1L3_9BACT|nr:hypothetical protein [Taibaiella chishuiensis]PSK91105.1 hypothetical protein B0I18_106116 [Taibaiella chishuiensis]
MLLKPFAAVIAALLSCSIFVQAIGMPAACLSSSNTEQPEVADSLPSGRAALQAIVDAGFPVDQRGSRQARFIDAATKLGDQYAAMYRRNHADADLVKAVYYYELVSGLRNGIDSELGDQVILIRARNKVCKQLALWYETGVLPADNIGSLYVGHVVDVRNLSLDNTCMGSIADTGGLSLQFIYGNAQLVQDAQKGLRHALRLAADTAPGRKIVISGNPGNSRLETQLAWERMKTITGFLVDNGWSADRIILNYGQTVLPGRVQLRLSDDGEDGPAALPPPAPRIWEEE